MRIGLACDGLGLRILQVRGLHGERKPPDREKIFYTLKKAQVLIEWWRCRYNRLMPHSSLGYRPPPAPQAVLPNSSMPHYHVPASPYPPTLNAAL